MMMEVFGMVALCIVWSRILNGDKLKVKLILLVRRAAYRDGVGDKFDELMNASTYSTFFDMWRTASAIRMKLKMERERQRILFLVMQKEMVRK